MVNIRIEILKTKGLFRFAVEKEQVRMGLARHYSDKHFSSTVIVLYITYKYGATEISEIFFSISWFCVLKFIVVRTKNVLLYYIMI